MITITALAAAHLRSMVEERFGVRTEPASSSMDGVTGGETGESAGLRILVEKGGCAGMQYTMQIDVQAPGDSVSEAFGGRVFVDPSSAPYLEGSELDYCDDLVGTGFRLRNPRATRSCGCGTSFEPASSESEAVSGGASMQTSPSQA